MEASARAAGCRVDLFEVDLDDVRWDRFLHVLDGAEAARAQRFLAPRTRQRHARCRAALRMILGRYLDCDPRDVALRIGRNGKPELAHGTWQFNVSHSEWLALVAVGRQALGIDVEWMRAAHAACAELAEDICHASELPAWRACDEAARRAWFYRAWTRKEAYAKALGSGLYERFAALHFGPGGRPGVCEVFNDDAPARRSGMFVHDLAVPDGFAASLCVAGADARLIRAGDGLPA